MSWKIHVSAEISESLPIWREFEDAGAMTPFQSRAWLLPLYDTLARDFKAEPLFLTVRNSDSAPILFLPLCRRRHLGAQVVEFPDFGVSDYNAPLMSRERVINRTEAPALLQKIVEVLGSANALRLDKLPPQVEGIDNPLAAFPGVRSIHSQSWGFGLPSTLLSYDRMVSSKFRKEIYRKRRRVAERGAVAFVQARTEQEKLTIFETLVRQRQARCDEMGRYHMLSDNRYRTFYETVLERDTTNDFVALQALTINDEIVGTALSLQHRQSCFMLMTSFEGGDWKKYSLGNVALHESISDNISKGSKFFDLTIGNESYKKSYGAISTPLCSVTRALTIMGLPHAVARTAVIAVRKKLQPTDDRRHRRRSPAHIIPIID